MEDLIAGESFMSLSCVRQQKVFQLFRSGELNSLVYFNAHTSSGPRSCIGDPRLLWHKSWAGVLTGQDTTTPAWSSRQFYAHVELYELSIGHGQSSPIITARQYSNLDRFEAALLANSWIQTLGVEEEAWPPNKLVMILGARLQYFDIEIDEPARV